MVSYLGSYGCEVFCVAQDNQLEQDLDRLRYAAMDLITRLARQFRHKRNGVIFLINNYTHLVQVGIVSEMLSNLKA